MTNWEKSFHPLNNIGVSSFDIPKELFDIFCHSAYASKEAGVKMKNRLAGRMREEYSIDSTIGIDPLISQFVLNCCSQGPIKEIISSIDVLMNPAPVVIANMWCNFQKKHEFNPMHNHSGFASFIVFVKIPYDLKEEEDFFGDGKGGNNSPTSKLSFLAYSHTEKENFLHLVDVDKSFEGKMLLFDAKHYHQVYPFYTSDDYRITISGNLKFEVN